MHGVLPQESVSPFHLVTSSTFIKGGEIIEIEIQADEGRRFKGFFMLVRTNADEPQVIGEFLEHEDEQKPFNYRDCYDGSHNAVTHFSNDTKESIKLKWKAPDDFTGSAHFQWDFT